MDSLGGERATITVRGVHFKHWAGQAVAANPTGDHTLQQLVAKHGRFTAVATRASADSLDAYAWFAARRGIGECIVGTLEDGTTDSMVGRVGELVVKKSAEGGIVRADVDGTAHHLYRFRLLTRTVAGVKRWSIARRADGLGHVTGRVAVSRHLRIRSFTKVRVTVTDLTAHAAPVHLSLSR